MGVADEIDSLMERLDQEWTVRFAELQSPTGSVTITVAPPDVDPLGYGVACPPGKSDAVTSLVILAPQSSSDGARTLLEVLPGIAAACHDAGWTPEKAQAADAGDHPAYLMRITRKGIAA